jgi:hypothetical protein
MRFGPDGSLFFNTNTSHQDTLFATGVWKLPAATSAVPGTPSQVILPFTSSGGSGSDVAFLKSGDLIAAEATSDYFTHANRVVRVPHPFDNPQAGTDFITGIENPAGLAIDPAGNVFVSQGPVSTNSSVYKYPPGGPLSVFATINNVLGGLVFDSDGNLYVGAGGGGSAGPSVVRIAPDGTQITFGDSSTTPGFGVAICPAGFLAFPVNGFTPWSTQKVRSIFDHWMENPYGCGDTNPDASQTLMAFTGEEAGRDVQGQRDTDSQKLCKPTGGCSNLYGWSNPSVGQFSLDGTYLGVQSCGNQKFLEYDGHPGIDYDFQYGTAVVPASSGTVHYGNGAAGGAPAKSYHTLEIDPGNGSAYRIFYLHLSSYICSSIAGSPDFWSGCAKSPGTPVRCVTDDSSAHKCLSVQQCSTCPREGDHVDINIATPIGYTGDYDLTSHCKGGWGCVGAHLHFQVDKSGIPVDPYGYDPQVPGAPKEDPYSSKFGHPAGINVLLWRDPRP